MRHKRSPTAITVIRVGSGIGVGVGIGVVVGNGSDVGVGVGSDVGAVVGVAVGGAVEAATAAGLRISHPPSANTNKHKTISNNFFITLP